MEWKHSSEDHPYPRDCHRAVITCICCASQICCKFGLPWSIISYFCFRPFAFANSLLCEGGKWTWFHLQWADRAARLFSRGSITIYTGDVCSMPTVKNAETVWSNNGSHCVFVTCFSFGQIAIIRSQGSACMTFIGVIIKSKSADTAGVSQSSIAVCTAPPKRGDIVERVLLNYPLCSPLHRPQNYKMIHLNWHSIIGKAFKDGIIR